MIPKFRAWDDINEKMIYDFYREKIEKVDGWYKGELVVRNKNEIHCDLLYSSKEEYLFRHVKELPLMQSTSLKDKNGVEIFEGDILKIIEVTNEGISEYITDVIWEDCSFVFKSEGVDYYDTFLGAFSGDPNTTYPLFELLVIGNVWDNPELLEGTE
ncbi:TPA: hypothetical protein I0H93_RS14995 [Enterococcus faecalis]|nr:hypothetical protein [Enterococcus faecalis]